MVKRTFLCLTVFLGSLAGVFLCSSAVRGDEHGSGVPTPSSIEASDHGYGGCWYDDDSGYCPYDMVQSAPTPAAEAPPDAETYCDDAYESKFYGYEWEYDDYDTDCESYEWLEPIADEQIQAAAESGAAQAETTATTSDEEVVVETATDEDSSNWMADEYEYWSEYNYDEEYRSIESAAPASDAPNTEVCSEASEPAATTSNDADVVEAWDEMDGYDDESYDESYDEDYGWESEYESGYESDYDYQSEYDYECCPVTEPAAAAAEEAVEVEIVEDLPEWMDEAVETEVADDMQGDAEANSDDAYDYSDYDYSDYYYGYGDYESYDSTEAVSDNEEAAESEDAAVEDESDVEAVEEPAPHRAAILTLARSLDQIGSALQMLSRQLTDMAAPEVAARAADSSQH
ncbi:MAG: hypothetical protein KJ000_03810 [Pirellulaceae bacterium]|nr:hypothetical protein [Pirellulaceae bacterium]